MMKQLLVVCLFALSAGVWSSAPATAQDRCALTLAPASSVSIGHRSGAYNVFRQEAARSNLSVTIQNQTDAAASCTLVFEQVRARARPGLIHDQGVDRLPLEIVRANGGGASNYLLTENGSRTGRADRSIRVRVAADGRRTVRLRLVVPSAQFVRPGGYSAEVRASVFADNELSAEDVESLLVRSTVDAQGRLFISTRGRATETSGRRATLDFGAITADEANGVASMLIQSNGRFRIELESENDFALQLLNAPADLAGFEDRIGYRASINGRVFRPATRGTAGGSGGLLYDPTRARGTQYRLEIDLDTGRARGAGTVVEGKLAGRYEDILYIRILSE
ncbi:MAG: hypothetical protein AAF674_17620 [Pseudomonadota bacterium]